MSVQLWQNFSQNKKLIKIREKNDDAATRKEKINQITKPKSILRASGRKINVVLKKLKVAVAHALQDNGHSYRVTSLGDTHYGFYNGKT